MPNFRILGLSFVLILGSHQSKSDSFKYNSYNNHGIIGLINMPSARFYNESVHGITFYDGTPDQKVTMSSNPYDWLEASFFYTNIQGRPYPGFEYQDYKDKGFNFKIRLKEEGRYPAIAIGINDIAGTGLYGSEYLVGSYGINNLDMHFGIGWGSYNGSKFAFSNPLINIYDNFEIRDENEPGYGGTGSFTPGRYFSGEKVSPFFGLSYLINNNFLLKFEHDTTLTTKQIEYKTPKKQYSIGVDYISKENFNLGLSYERGNTLSIRFSYKNNPKESIKKYQYKKSETIKSQDDKYKKLIKNIENNGIGVNKIIESANSIGLELTQFTHSNLDIIEEIITSASIDSGVNKDIKTDLRIADLQAKTDFDEDFIKNSKTVYERKGLKRFYTSNSLALKPFLASREEFFKGALLFENNSEYIIKDNFFFSSNIKYSLLDNFDDLNIPPINTYPAQVRSDIKDYLRNIDEGIIIGRAQFDYHITPKKNHHLMFTGGILEEMFSGYGGEYLYFKNNSNYAIGFEIFNAKKRDHKMRFGTQDYENITHSLNFYYRNYDYIPFDMKISYGEYLAGDKGSTIEFSRSFANGTKYGVFASFTDVTSEQYGEGSFDKGIFFNIPIYGNFINYTWRPLTKDPGAKLIRKHTLYDLLVKFKPYN
tara:strand:- start:1646 stop:3598 length:1953 start_codon:yes stop_codon:yes gene_type:complete